MKSAIASLMMLAACSTPAADVASEPPPKQWTDAQKTEVRALIAAKREAIAKEAAARRAAIAEALQVKKPGGACPEDVTTMVPAAGRTADLAAAVANLDLVMPKVPNEEDPDLNHLFEFDARMLEEKLAKPPSDADYELQRARSTFAVKPPPARRLVLAVDRLVRPKTDKDGTFTAGTISGALYLYDAAANRMLCVAPVDATSSELVHAQKFNSPVSDILDNSALFADLVNVTLAQGAPKMRALPPPMPKKPKKK